MPDVILTSDEFEALKNLRQAAAELVTGIPYITMAGGNITRQNILVQALATALEVSRNVDFEKMTRENPYISDDIKRQFEGETHVTPKRRRTRSTAR